MNSRDSFFLNKNMKKCTVPQTFELQWPSPKLDLRVSAEGNINVGLYTKLSYDFIIGNESCGVLVLLFTACSIWYGKCDSLNLFSPEDLKSNEYQNDMSMSER